MRSFVRAVFFFLCPLFICCAEQNVEKVCIIGSGPAGYTASIYLARAMLKPVLFEGFFSGIPGGQLMTTTIIENYPGFPEGIEGSELMSRMRQQACRFGTKMVPEDIVSIDCSKRPFLVETPTYSFYAENIVIATGAFANRLDIPGTRDGELWHKGVSSCAVCDGASLPFREKELVVIGGGDSAVEEALFLTQYASRVYIVHRRDQLRASSIMTERALHHPQIEIIWDSVVEAVQGNDWVESVHITNVKTHETIEKKVSGLFFAVGHTPNTAFLRGQLECDSQGYITVQPGTCRTSVPGIWAVGDVQDCHWRQAVTAAASGCMAALDIARSLE